MKEASSFFFLLGEGELENFGKTYMLVFLAQHHHNLSHKVFGELNLIA
jgi:hypothetical protein